MRKRRSFRCRVCGEPAQVRLEYANLSLCSKHFVEYFERRVKRTILRYKLLSEGEKIGVALSGGKDSAVLLHVLSKLRDEFNVELYAIHVNLGIGQYSKHCEEIIREQAKVAGVSVIIANFREEYGLGVPELSKILRRAPCSICGTIKRYLLNKVAWENQIDRIATGHTLNDAASDILYSFMTGNYEWLAKIGPLSPKAEKLVARIKPLFETPESDILLYAKFENVKFTEEICPLAKGASRLEMQQIISTLEEKHPGIMFSLVRNYIKKLKPIIQQEFNPQREFTFCSLCGYPSTGKVCSFCKMIQQAKKTF